MLVLCGSALWWSLCEKGLSGGGVSGGLVVVFLMEVLWNMVVVVVPKGTVVLGFVLAAVRTVSDKRSNTNIFTIMSYSVGVLEINIIPSKSVKNLESIWIESARCQNTYQKP